MWTWLKSALSEKGEPSSARLIMFLWAVTLIPTFVFCAIWELAHTDRMPAVAAGWGALIGFGQAGASVGYAVSKIAGAIGTKPEAPKGD